MKKAFAKYKWALYSTVLLILLSVFYWAYPSKINWLWSGTLEDTRNRIWIFVTLIGIFLLIWRTVSANRTSVAAMEQVVLTRKGNITGRFAKAVELLGSSSQTTVIGGIYALEQIAQEDAPTYHNVVFEILTAFIRNNARIKKEKESSRPEDVRSEIQAALTVIGRRQNIEIENGRKWYLWYTDLKYMNLENGHFENFNLYGVNLTEARMSCIHLEKAWLGGAILVGARLNGAYLKETLFQDTNLSHADFHKAIIKKTDLRRTTGIDMKAFCDAEIDEDSMFPDNSNT
ncbi:hypothetical protein GMMP15_810032 [Candidatus Magnetomoraceae bacterium gMMP-15]